MTQARLVVDIKKGPWIADVSREHPEADFKVLAALPGDGPGFALVWITAESVEEVLQSMRSHPSMTDMSVVQKTDHEATVQLETSAPDLLIAAKRSGLPIEMPVEIQDGEATIDVTGAHERLSAFGEHLEAIGLEFDVQFIQERLQPSQLLTDTQRALLLTAVELGYYDTPRECSLTELAEHVDLAKSTCSETLHRAEEVVIKDYVEKLPAEMDEVPDRVVNQ